MKTQAMVERENSRAGVIWEENSETGYFHGSGYGPLGFRLLYIAIPENHPDVGKHYDDLDNYGPEVNGGLTFSKDNVFGWDYGHFDNHDDYDGDFQRALDYFSNHELK